MSSINDHQVDLNTEIYNFKAVVSQRLHIRAS